MGKLHIFKTTHELLETITELENELKEYRKLQSEVHKDIEKVWMYDNSKPLNEIGETERTKLIESVFYKIGNQWID